MAYHALIHTQMQKLCLRDIYLITGDWIPFCGIVFRCATHTPWSYQIAPGEVVERKCSGSLSFLMRHLSNLLPFILWAFRFGSQGGEEEIFESLKLNAAPTPLILHIKYALSFGDCGLSDIKTRTFQGLRQPRRKWGGKNWLNWKSGRLFVWLPS